MCTEERERNLDIYVTFQRELEFSELNYQRNL